MSDQNFLPCPVDCQWQDSYSLQELDSQIEKYGDVGRIIYLQKEEKKSWLCNDVFYVTAIRFSPNIAERFVDQIDSAHCLFYFPKLY